MTGAVFHQKKIQSCFQRLSKGLALSFKSLTILYWPMTYSLLGTA